MSLVGGGERVQNMCFVLHKWNLQKVCALEKYCIPLVCSRCSSLIRLSSQVKAMLDIHSS